MKSLCAECNICHDFLPEQHTPRVLVTDNDEEPKGILVIDDAYNGKHIGYGLLTANELLGPGYNFDYTSTIRCHYNHIDSTHEAIALARCSVWTHSLLDNRRIILATKKGLTQMGVGSKMEGDMYKSGKYGLILCIPPLHQLMLSDDVETYRTKVRRLIRDVIIKEVVV